MDGGDLWDGACSSAMCGAKRKADNSVLTAAHSKDRALQPPVVLLLSGARGTTGSRSRQNEQKKNQTRILVAVLFAPPQHFWVQYGHMQTQEVSQAKVLPCISLLPSELLKLLTGARSLRYHSTDGLGSDIALASGLAKCYFCSAFGVQRSIHIYVLSI